MRVLPILYTLFASSVIAQSSGDTAEKKEVTADAEDAADGPPPTIFNGVEVPPITILDGETFNATVKEGLWFVKHHS